MSFVLVGTTSSSPTPDEICAARWWALDHDHEALLAHRVARSMQADWAEQAAADERLVARHRAAALAF
ncbi:MAG: hypothetical protein FWF90_01130 [Promicromonosporaceae bacterium]|nr:hypothetical protein [Promicromonosporaceae bacterium]